MYPNLLITASRTKFAQLDAAVVEGLLSRLDVVDRRWDAGIAAIWRDLSEPAVTRADYIAALLRTYGFVAPLESACRYTPGLDRILETRSLTCAGLLAQDLLTLGISPHRVATIPQCRSITTFVDVPEALGWLYVAYRATPAQEIARTHLAHWLPEVEDACAYLTALERGSWWELEQAIERLDSHPEVSNVLVAAANEGFACAQRWAEAIDLDEWRKTG